MKFFEINDLNVKIDDKPILNHFNININKGEVVFIMGPNGTGKSTLSKVIMGNPDYTVTSGNINFLDEDITNISTNKRSLKGIFLALQSPNEIEGISNLDFLKAIYETKNNTNIGVYDFLKIIDKYLNKLNIDKNMLYRDLNTGFSGGEKKKNEMLQMNLLEPKLIILDEIDSGLDVDSLKLVCKNINEYKETNNDTSIIIITHNNKLMDLIKPDRVMVIKDGTIIKEGDYNLALNVEKYGFDNINLHDGEE